MNRLEKSKQIRRKILSYIRRNPGCHYRQILKRLELSSGSLAYHLLKIEENKNVFAVYDGYWKRFYPISMKDETILDRMTPRQKKIYDLIKKRPGSTYMDIVKKLGKTRPTFVYHTEKLMKMNLIRRELVKGKFHFYVDGKVK